MALEASHISDETRTGDRPLILHLTREYPDDNQPMMTRAVKNFIVANEDVDHFVVSLHRSSNPLALFSPFQEHRADRAANRFVLSKRYWGLPLGLLTAFSMMVIAFGVRRQVIERGVRPNIVHAHKLTYEGFAAFLLARWLGLPMVCSIRGEVEWKFFTFKPYYMPLFRWILARTERIYYVSAWFRPAMHKHFDIDPAVERLLPNFVDMAGIAPQDRFEKDRFVSILHLDIFEKKGLNRLLDAFERLKDTLPEARLDVIGRGEPETIARIERLIDRHGLRDRVSLLGWMPNEQVLARLGGYAGMLLPSHNETFGMSYVEAMLCGVPILYSKGTGIEGYVDDVEAAVRVDPKSVDEIVSGILRLSRHQDTFRDWLLSHHAELIERFSAGPHIQAYNRDIRAILDARAQKKPLHGALRSGDRDVAEGTGTIAP